jgi:NADPH-dependent F420 reductase
MRVAIIGSGNVGKALAGSLTKAGHEVTLTATTPESAQAAADQTGAQGAKSNQAAVESAEVVVLAVPYPALDGLLDDVGDHLDGKVVVDATNRMNPNDFGATLDGTSATEQIQAKLPGARVVKAFNTLFASRQADPVVDGVALDALVAGDDEDAKRQVLKLAESIGLRPIDAGPACMARAMEALALLNITLQIRNNWPWQAGFKLVGPTP